MKIMLKCIVNLSDKGTIMLTDNISKSGSLVSYRTLRTLLLFLEDDKLTLSDISSKLGISKTAAYRIVFTLTEMNFLLKDDYKRYMLGPVLLKLSKRVDNNIRSVALPVMKQLSEETGESVYLSVSYNIWHYFFIEGVESYHPIKWSVSIGQPETSLGGAAGKVHLAYREIKGLNDKLKAAKFTAYTDNTITEYKKLSSELEKIRKEGVSLSFGERYEDVVGISCPILDYPTDGEVAALSIFMPEFRFRPEQLPDLIAKLKKASREIFLLLEV